MILGVASPVQRILSTFNFLEDLAPLSVVTFLVSFVLCDVAEWGRDISHGQT